MYLNGRALQEFNSEYLKKIDFTERLPIFPSFQVKTYFDSTFYEFSGQKINRNWQLWSGCYEWASISHRIR